MVKCEPTHNLTLLVQYDGLAGSIPEPQGLVVGGGNQEVATGTHGQGPDLPMVALRGHIQGDRESQAH